MALELNPSGRGLLVGFGIALIVGLWLYSSGALLTLVALAVIVTGSLYLLWVLFIRMTRRLAGA
jgi:hypothetical protein